MITKPDPIRVRIVHFLPHSRNYCIQYHREHSLWPFWHTIQHYIWETWFPRYCWNPVLLEYEKAKKFAASFTDYSDVLKYNETQKAKERHALEYRANKLKALVPVEVEEITP